LPGTLCTLSSASLNNNSVVTSLIPLARSYDGFDWERAAGDFATSFYRNQSWTCDYNSSSCQITLPSLQNGMRYRIASYNRSLSQRDEIARFLETTTFGVTQVELAQFYNITDNGNNTGNLQMRMARWILNASLVGITSHREYWRQRANMRVCFFLIFRIVSFLQCSYHLMNFLPTDIRLMDLFVWVYRIIHVKRYLDGEPLPLVNWM
jgi:hypothetical protein